MERFSKLFIILMCLVGTVSLASCLGNDDNGGGLDPETERQARYLMSGSYNGASTSNWMYKNRIYFLNYDIEEEDKTDSIMGITARFMTDSTFTIYGVTGNALAKEIPDEYEGLKNAIKNYPETKEITGRYMIYSVNQNIYFVPFNTTVAYKGLEYDGETHDVTISFWGSPYSYGGYASTGGITMINMNLVMGGVFIDNDSRPDIEFYAGSQPTSQEQLDAMLQVILTR